MGSRDLYHDIYHSSVESFSDEDTNIEYESDEKYTDSDGEDLDMWVPSFGAAC